MSERSQDVQVEAYYAETPARIFDAWLSVESIREWLFPPGDQFLITTIDPVVGGRFNFTVLRGGQKIEHSGTYSEIERPRRLVFTWELPQFSTHKGRVIISITAIGTGTKLLLIHEDIPEEFFDKTKKGWTMILDRLDESFQVDTEDGADGDEEN